MHDINYAATNAWYNVFNFQNSHERKVSIFLAIYKDLCVFSKHSRTNSVYFQNITNKPTKQF